MSIKKHDYAKAFFIIGFAVLILQWVCIIFLRDKTMRVLSAGFLGVFVLLCLIGGVIIKKIDNFHNKNL